MLTIHKQLYVYVMCIYIYIYIYIWRWYLLAIFGTTQIGQNIVLTCIAAFFASSLCGLLFSSTARLIMCQTWTRGRRTWREAHAMMLRCSALRNIFSFSTFFLSHRLQRIWKSQRQHFWRIGGCWKMQTAGRKTGSLAGYWEASLRCLRKVLTAHGLQQCSAAMLKC